MQFAAYLPPHAERRHVPVIWFRWGLTCTKENFTAKADAQRVAAELGVIVIAPDTSPRGPEVPDDPEGAYDLGCGAGFWVDATVGHGHGTTGCALISRRNSRPSLRPSCPPILSGKASWVIRWAGTEYRQTEAAQRVMHCGAFIRSALRASYNRGGCAGRIWTLCTFFSAGAGIFYFSGLAGIGFSHRACAPNPRSGGNPAISRGLRHRDQRACAGPAN